MISLIVARDKNGLIGANGQIPWIGQLPNDLKWFRNITMGHIVVMGRKTFESIGKPLPGRKNIVVSRTQHEYPGCICVDSPETAIAWYIKHAQEHQDLFVIGGAIIYKEFMPYVKRMYITDIDAEFEGDTYFLPIDPDEWHVVYYSSHKSDKYNLYDYSFTILDKALITYPV